MAIGDWSFDMVSCTHSASRGSRIRHAELGNQIQVAISIFNLAAPVQLRNLP